MNQRCLLTLMTALALAVPLSAGPLLFNGGFELPDGIAQTAFVFGDTFVRCYLNGDCQRTQTPPYETGPGGIQGWTITQGGMDYMGTHWTAAEGLRSVDLNGAQGPGGISQILDTVVGQLYRLTFALSGNFDMPGIPVGSRTVNVQAAGVSQNFTFVKPDNWSHDNMGWVVQTFVFTAIAPSTTLTFSAADHDSYGPVIDAADVILIPEPASVLLLGAGILALAGLARSRRKR